MSVSVQLDEETRKLLDGLARPEGLSCSEVVRRSIHLLVEQRTRGESTPFETIEHLVSARGGPRNLSERIGAEDLGAR
ncbi:MAG: ribbon-helix-helix protein, CopG family [Thermoanaerobaculia bacterium]